MIEIIHHKDGNKLNNKLSNLKLLKNVNQHSTLHYKERIIDNKGRFVEEVSLT